MRSAVLMMVLTQSLLTAVESAPAEHPVHPAAALAGHAGAPRDMHSAPQRPAAVRAVLRQDDGLPEGEGKKILQASCTSCHDLTEVTKFKGYLTRDDWRDIVRTMVEYGAAVKPADVDVLVDYLARNLGKRE